MDKFEYEKKRDTREIDNLLEKHDTQTKEFDEYWSNPDNMKAYTKSSGELISLRARQKSLLLAKMYDEAEIIRKEVETLEAKETKQATEVIQKVIQKKRKKMENEQQQELLKSRQFSLKLVEDLKTQMVKEEEQLQARLSKLHQDLKALESKNISTENKNKADLSASLSPRSKTLIDNFKRKTTPKRLILKPLSPARVKPSKNRSKSASIFYLR